MKPAEILDKEKLCIEERAPFCMAECPVHFDARNMNLLLEKGDYQNAYELYQKAVLFPGLVSSQCEAPCEKKCKRGEAGGSIKIKELERAMVERGRHKIALPKSDMKISKRIALVEDGLDALAIIYVLLGKGYSPHIFTFKSEVKVGDDDFDFLNDPALTKHTNQTFGKEFVEKLTADFDAVYFSDHTKESFFSLYEGLAENRKYFFSSPTDSVIEKISLGKQAAISIDRFAKGVSLTAGRKNEGSYETELFTSVDGIEPQPPTPKTGSIYSDSEVRAESERCIKCHCLECVKQCAFMQKFEKFPRVYIREAFNNISTDGRGFRSLTNVINSCTLCGACGAICPNHIPMAEIYQSAREVLVHKEAMPPRYHEYPLRDMHYSNSDAVSFFRPPKGGQECRYMFFPGCHLAASTPEYIKPVFEYLSQALNDEVGLMLGCCGAPAIWAGRRDIYDQVMGQFKQIWIEAGQPTIITACPTCNREFTEALPEAEVKTAWHYYSTMGLPEGSADLGKKVTISVHDPCTSRYREDMHEEIRAIIDLRGHRIEEYKYSKNLTRCCGYGGLISYSDAPLAHKFAETRVAETKTGLVTYCAVCRDFLAKGEKPVYHILDLIYGHSDQARGLRKKTGISDKMANRLELKKNLLKELWGEDPADEIKEHDAISLIIGDEARKILEDRLILEDNVREVIFNAEKNGQIVANPKTGDFVAHKRIGIVTYWVRYEKSGDLYCIKTAYSHRIQITEE